MKKRIIRIAVLFVVFILSVIIIGNITNRGNTDMTAEIANATYPIITTVVDGMEVNTLHGYTNEMQAEFMRDTITPLNEERKLALHIKESELAVKEIAYEVRSLDTTRLVEDNKVNGFENKDGISVEIPVKDLIDKGTEYILTIILKCSSRNPVLYQDCFDG